jgi:hypothetical protein
VRYRRILFTCFTVKTAGSCFDGERGERSIQRKLWIIFTGGLNALLQIVQRLFIEVIRLIGNRRLPLRVQRLQALAILLTQARNIFGAFIAGLQPQPLSALEFSLCASRGFE